MECQETLFSTPRRRCYVQHVVLWRKPGHANKLCGKCLLRTSKNQLEISELKLFCSKQQKPVLFEEVNKELQRIVNGGIHAVFDETTLVIVAYWI